jgi:hypothetical protein
MPNTPKNGLSGGQYPKRHFANVQSTWLVVRLIIILKGLFQKNGYSFRFNTKTGEFLTIHPNGHIETFFRPEQGIDYYLKQVQLHGK